MKIAVCLFGQLRTAEYCAPWIKESFNFSAYDRETMTWEKQNHWDTGKYEKYEQPFQVDYFCDFKTSSFTTNDVGDKKKLHTPRDIDKIRSLYNPVAEHITPDAVDVIIANNRPFAGKMFSSMCRTVLLKQQYELQNNFMYDAVFLHRYDVLTGPSPTALRDVFHPHGVQPLCIYGEHTSNIRFVNEGFRAGFMDLLLWGDSFSIDSLCARLYQNWAVCDPEQLKHEFSFGPNVALSIAVSDVGLAFHPLHIGTTIVRKTADLSIPVFDSYAYHETFWVGNAVWNQK